LVLHAQIRRVGQSQRVARIRAPKTRGRWLSMMAFLVVAGFPATALLGYLIIPAWGWRPMFVIAGVGSLIVWYLRKNLPGLCEAHPGLLSVCEPDCPD
jgi:MFS family permease